MPDAARQADMVYALTRFYRDHAYELVRAPMVEFAESASDGFQTMDPVTQQMLAIRSDMTPQIGRLASKRLKDAARPLKLCYSGTVLRLRGEGLHAERQLVQVGAEHIGEDSLDADIAMMVLAADSIKEQGVQDITLECSVPPLANALIGNNAEARQAVAAKDWSALERALGADAAVIIAAGTADSLEALRQVNLPAEASEYIDALKQIVDKLTDALAGVEVRIDVLEQRGFDYYTGVSFGLYAAGSNEELGRGGRYEIAESGEGAVGFSLAVDALLRAQKT